MLLKTFKGHIEVNETSYMPNDIDLHIMWNRSHRQHFASFADFKSNYGKAVRAAILLNVKRAKAIDAKTYLDSMPAFGKYSDLEYTFKALIPEVTRSKQWNRF